MRQPPPALPPSPRPAGLSLAFRLALVVNLGLAVTWLVGWTRLANEGAFWQADFSMLYTGWRMVLEGDRARLYDLDRQLEVQRRLVPERGTDAGLLPFNYPPHAAVPAAALGLLPRDAAFYTWAGVNLMVLGLILRRLVALCLDRPACLLLVVTVLAFPPTYMTFQLGQLSLFVLLCQVEFTRALYTRRSDHGALSLVLGTVKPQLMLAPPALLLGGRHWRTLALAACFFALWAAVTTVTLGVGSWIDWLRIVVHSARQAGDLGIAPAGMYNLKALFLGVFGEGRLALVNLLSAAALAGGWLSMVWLWGGSADPTSPDFAPRLALSLVVALLIDPHVNPSDVVVLVLPATLFLAHLHTVRRQPRAFAALCLASPLIFVLDRLAGTAWPLGLSPFRIVMIIFAGWAAREVARCSEGGPP